MTRLAPLGIAQRKRKARLCVICHAAIEAPTWNQQACPGECARKYALKAERKRRSSKEFRKERRRIGAIGGRKPERNRGYLNFLKGCRCIVCQATPCDPCHVGVRGLRQKSSDMDALPMCRLHHEMQHRYGHSFWTHWELRKDELIAAFNLAFRELQEKGAAA